MRLPTVDRRMIGTYKRSESDERSRRRDGMSATRVGVNAIKEEA